MTTKQRIDILLKKYAARQITAPEWEELRRWMQNATDSDKEALGDLQEDLWEQAKAGTLPSSSHPVHWDTMLQTVMSAGSEPPAVSTIPPSLNRRVWFRFAAAVVLFIAGISFYQWYGIRKTPNSQTISTTSRPSRPDISPGGNRAFLTLSDGSTIVLDSAADGNLARQGRTKIVKLSSGIIAYDIDRKEIKDEPISYNTITTPSGGQYKLILPDGSKVWLNAASSLRYPATFTGITRTVDLTGEAYFEIAPYKDQAPAQPFHVNYQHIDIQVLGTQFNVMAYQDEPAIHTTVLQGAVKITNGAESGLLKPGKQAIINRISGNIMVKTGDTSLAVAWKNGYFSFEQADIHLVLRQISRWYNLEIVYQGSVSPDLFSGKIERKLPLSKILRLLNQGNFHVKLEGKKLLVLTS